MLSVTVRSTVSACAAFNTVATDYNEQALFAEELTCVRTEIRAKLRMVGGRHFTFHGHSKIKGLASGMTSSISYVLRCPDCGKHTSVPADTIDSLYTNSECLSCKSTAEPAVVQCVQRICVSFGRAVSMTSRRSAFG